MREKSHKSTLLPLAVWVLAAAMVAPRANASNWEQFLGPTRNGVYTNGDLAKSWPKEGPPVVWQRKVGQGFSGPVLVDGKLILFHRVEDKETVECLETGTGKVVWRFDYPTGYRDDFGFDEGPRATPCVAAGRVFTYGAEGVLNCLDLATGTNVWRKNTKEEYEAAKGFFGIACSPLVEGGAVLLNVGGRKGNGILAFETGGGKLLWKASDDEASYSSPAPATINNTRYVFFLTRAGLVAVEPPSGKVLWKFPFRPPTGNSVSAATPLVVGDSVFITASYGAGAALLKIKPGAPEKLWSADDALSSHYATSVYADGFLYGIHGRTDPGFGTGASLRCVELKTGKVRWEKGSFGAAIVTLAGDQLVILTEKGELLLAPASSSGFKENARAQVLPNQARAHPALADGRFYARSKDQLVCLDLTKGK